MKSFDYNGKQVEFHTVTGQIAGAHKRSETHVSGSGGGGSTYNGQGRTAPINITTTVIVKQEFFVKSSDGQDVPVKLNNEDIPLMDGQHVTMISGHADNVGIWTHLVNHNAARYWKLGHTLDHVFKWDLVRKPWISMSIGIAVWIAVAYLLNGMVGFFAAVAYWIYEGMKVSAAAKRLENYMDGLGREALTQDAAAS